nr:glycosyltransferase family 4 protein [Anaerolineae bacterium]
MTHDQLKILMALQYYVPHRTGLTQYVQRVAESLAARGHEVTVLTARYDNKLARDETVINGVRVIRLWAPLRVSRGMVMPAYPEAAYKLVRMHDVVNIHVPLFETFIYALYTRWMNKGLIVTLHGDLVLPKGLFNAFVRWFTFRLYKSAGKAAHHVVAYSEDYADHSYYIAPFRDKTIEVHPPIVIPTPDRDTSQIKRKEWLGDAGANARLIGYAGRFVEEKRPDILIKALDTIHQHYPGSKIVFAGEYALKYEDFFERCKPLLDQYREHLIFLGLLTDSQEVADFYAACDVLALPSDTECFALVQVEAMRCGTPVVATDIPGARIVVQKTGMGEIVPPRNPEALGQAITRVLDNPEKYIKPIEDIERVFSLERTVDAYEHMLREAAYQAARQQKTR